MLWYKSWLETRSRFLIGLVLLICSAFFTVLSYPQVLRLLSLVPSNIGGEIGRRVQEVANLEREYRGYIWWEWFRHNLPQTWTIFAVLLGTGGLVSQPSGRGALFTLSMPVSRNRLIGVRAATGLAELFVLAFVPSILIPLVSPAIGQSYGVADALAYSACLFIAGSVFFSLATLLSTVFNDVWRPLLFALGPALLLSLFEQALAARAGAPNAASQMSSMLLRLSQLGIFHTMHGEHYFRVGQLPWLGLLFSGALSAALQYGAAKSIARRDF